MTNGTWIYYISTKNEFTTKHINYLSTMPETYAVTVDVLNLQIYDAVNLSDVITFTSMNELLQWFDDRKNQINYVGLDNGVIFCNSCKGQQVIDNYDQHPELYRPLSDNERQLIMFLDNFQCSTGPLCVDPKLSLVDTSMIHSRVTSNMILSEMENGGLPYQYRSYLWFMQNFNGFSYNNDLFFPATIKKFLSSRREDRSRPYGYDCSEISKEVIDEVNELCKKLPNPFDMLYKQTVEST